MKTIYLLKMTVKQVIFFQIYHLHTLVQGTLCEVHLYISIHCVLRPLNMQKNLYHMKTTNTGKVKYMKFVQMPLIICFVTILLCGLGKENSNSFIQFNWSRQNHYKQMSQSNSFIFDNAP